MIGGDWTNVTPMGNGGGKLPAGGYVIRITKAEDVPGKEYLLVEYDVAEGEYAGHYKDLEDRFGFWGGSFVRSYKPKARGFFKAFLDALEASNNITLATPNGVDEQRLVGLLCGVVLGEEEYIGNDGTVKTGRVHRPQEKETGSEQDPGRPESDRHGQRHDSGVLRG